MARTREKRARILLTGGSGFIAAHVLDYLLARGHSVVTTVRSQQKAEWIKSAHPDTSKDNLDFAIVEDISRPDAFDEAVISDPPFEVVIHTASPFHYNVTDVKKDLLDPAVIGTTGILKAIKKSAPSVRRVVITSSFAAIIDPKKLAGKTYSEADWNPITEAEALENPNNGYRASKTFAERAAWDFVEKENPNFTLASCNPPLVLGPIVHYLNSLDALNTSNQRIRNFMTGAAKEECPPSGVNFFVDVRDVALSHVLAAFQGEAAGKRFFIVADKFSNKQIAEIMSEKFPHLRDLLPTGNALKSGDFPATGTPDFDNTRSVEVLGIKYRSLTESVVDTVKSLQAVDQK
ncbi:methylglyoxal reductase (NADPH-dependent) gre2 [Pseudocyphellaria aurata]|nr:methylglyoxal reductase (NADPH-dependent) gre2 [Pseudocyphellaria aurata]